MKVTLHFAAGEPRLDREQRWISSGGACQVFEVRLHGRGGQGVVTGATLLSVAAFYEGLRAQAFPSFGSKRMGHRWSPTAALHEARSGFESRCWSRMP